MTLGNRQFTNDVNNSHLMYRKVSGVTPWNEYSEMKGIIDDTESIMGMRS